MNRQKHRQKNLINLKHSTIFSMTYTEEQLQQIDQFASIYLRPTDIAVILGVHRHGKALSKVQLHQQEMTLAKVGSPLALQTARENLLDMEDDE